MAATNTFLTLLSTVQTNSVGSTIATGYIPYVSTAGRQAYTNTPTVSTPALGDNSTNVPTTAFLQNFIYPQGLFTGLVGTWNSNTTATWTANQITLWNANGQPYLARTVNITINTGNTVGTANGLDTGTLAANTWYNIYCIYNGATVASLLSISATAPTLPSGYTYFSRIGTVYLDGSKNMRGFKQYRNRTQWMVGSNLSTMPVINNTAVGNVSTPTYTAYSVATFVPPTAMSIIVVLTCYNSGVNNVALVSPNASYGAYGVTSNPPVLTCSTASSVQATIVLETTNIYIANLGNCIISTNSYEDNF